MNHSTLYKFCFLFGFCVLLLPPLEAQELQNKELGLWQPLESLKNQHPRIFLNTKKISEVRLAIAKDSLAKKHFESLVRWFDQKMAMGTVPVYVEPKTDYWEALEFRTPAEELVGMAFLYRITEDSKYLAAAKKWLAILCQFPKWGKYDKRGYTINDLGGSTMQYALALAYDWLYQDLTSEERKLIRESLEKKTDEVYGYVETKKEAFWASVPMHNHNWINSGGVLMAGLALYGETPQANEWIRFAVSQYQKAFETYFKTGDGASHEGFAYWDYGTKKFTVMAQAVKELCGIDFFAQNQWMENTIQFGIYSALPTEYWTSREVKKTLNGIALEFKVPDQNGLTFGDGPRRTWGTATSYMLYLACRYQNGAARWYAEKASASSTEALEDQWLEVLWDDPSVKAVPPATLPTWHHFENLGLVVSRSSWAGNENVAAFKCGPPGGHTAIDIYSEHPGTGHSAPDAGSLQLFAYGDFLLVGPGYAEKWTKYQNSLLINGQGQIDEGKPFYWANTFFSNKLHPRIDFVKSTSSGVEVCANVQAAYAKESGLTKFRRTLISRQPNVWIIIDDLEASQPSSFEIYFHSDYAFVANPSGRYICSGPSGSLAISSFSKELLGASAAFQNIKYIQPPKNAPVGLQTLVLSNAQLFSKLTVLHVLEAYPSASGSASSVGFENNSSGDSENYLLTIKSTSTESKNTRSLRLKKKDKKDYFEIEDFF
jgi:hypothetical protein